MFDYQKSLEGYFSTFKVGQLYSTEGLCRYLKNKKRDEKETETILAHIFINVFGLVELAAVNRPKVLEIPLDTEEARRLTAIYQNALTLYKSVLKRTIDDFRITVRYHLTDIICNLASTAPIPPKDNVSYSWKKTQRGASVTPDMQLILDNSVRCLNVYPFPNQLAKLLGVDRNIRINAELEKEKDRFNLARDRIFAEFSKQAQTETGRSSSTFFPWQEEELLLKRGALYNKKLSPTSWMHEIDEWIKTGKSSIGNPSRKFRLGFLTHQFATIHLARTSTSRHSSSSSALDLSSPVYNPDEDRSFQAYLIGKTLDRLFSFDRLLSRKCNLTEMEKSCLHQILGIELYQRFERDDSLRLDFLFFSQLMHSLCFPEKKSNLNLRELVDWRLPLNNKLNAYHRLEILQTLLFSKEDLQMQMFANIFVNFFILKYFAIDEMTLEKEGRLLIWLYHKQTSPAADMRGFWEIVLQGKIPNKVINRLNRTVKDETCFACVYDWACLISDHPALSLVEECFNNLKMNLKFSSVKQQAWRGEEPKRIADRREIFLQHEFRPSHPDFPLMDAILHLMCMQDYMELSGNAQEFFFTRLLHTTAQDRKECLSEIIRFASQLKKLRLRTDDPLILRRQMLATACNNKAEEDPNLAPFLEWYENPSAAVDVQIRFIKEIEKIVRPPLSFQIVLGLYSPFLDVPLLFEQLEKLLNLKMTQGEFQTKDLFLPPSLPKEIDELINIIFDPSVMIAARWYGGINPHSLGLEFYFGALSNAVQAVLIPSFSSFCDPIIELAEPLFSTQGRTFHSKQNFVYAIGGDHFTYGYYTGEWQGILHMTNWKHSPSTGLGTSVFSLEMTFWPSLYRLETRTISVELNLSSEDLSPTALSLLSSMLEDISHELGEHRAPRIEAMQSEEDEIALCLEILDYKEKWEQFINAGNQRIATELFRFVKRLKIAARNALYACQSSTPPSHISSPVSSTTTLTSYSSESPIPPMLASASHSHALFASPEKVEQQESVLELLQAFCKECSSYDGMGQVEISEIDGPQGKVKIVLCFDPMGSVETNVVPIVSSPHSSSAEDLPHLEQVPDPSPSSSSPLSISPPDDEPKEIRNHGLKTESQHKKFVLHSDPEGPADQSTASSSSEAPHIKPITPKLLLNVSTSGPGNRASLAPQEIFDNQPEKAPLNKFSAVLYLDGEQKGEYSLMLGSLVHHPRACHLLQWMVEQLKSKYIEYIRTL